MNVSCGLVNRLRCKTVLVYFETKALNQNVSSAIASIGKFQPRVS